MIIFLGNAHSNKFYEPLINQSIKDDLDIVVSCQYPYRVPESLIKSHICVNIHYGTLPFFAGCNPIYWQLMKSDKAGVTLHYMDKDFDSGDIIDIKELPTAGMTADEVYEALSGFGLELFKKNYKAILRGTAHRQPQNKTFRNYYRKEDADFTDTLVNGDTKKLRALHFKGKQYPTIKIDGRVYEVRSCNSGV